MKRNIRWLRLELDGFGVWRDPIRFVFPAGLGVFCLPNEGGKSTMAAGLTSVLFGLSGESDPAKAGIGRYRSWNDPGHCRGRLDLQIDERTIRILRNFPTHETTVDEIDRAGNTVRMLFQGNANPGGRNPLATQYRELLGSFLGDLADQELFEAFLVIGQEGIPEGRLGEALRRLVSGVGRVGGEEARAVLFEEVKALTRATGDLGLASPGSDRPTNQRKDGEIERQERQIAEMEGRTAEISASFETLVRLEADLEEAIEEAAVAERDEAHAQADAAAIEDYRRHSEATERARSACEDLSRALEAFDQRSTGTHAERERLARDFPDLADAGDDLEEAIEEAVRAKALVDSLRDERERAMKTREEAEARVHGRETFVSEAAVLAEAEDPVGVIAAARVATDRWLREVAQYHEAHGRLAALEAEGDRLKSVGTLAPEERERLLRLDAALAEMDQRAAMRVELSTTRQAGREDLERRREEFRKRWSQIESLDATRFLAILEDRAKVHRRVWEIEQELPRPDEAPPAPVRRPGARRGWILGLSIGLPASVLAAVACWAAGLAPGIAVGAGFATLILTVGFLLLRRKRAEVAPSPQPSLELEVRTLRARLRAEHIPSGPWFPDDEGLVERARDLFRRREEEAASLAASEAALGAAAAASPPGGDPEEIAAQKEALADLGDWIAAATGRSAPEAVRAWQRLEHAIEEARAVVLSRARALLPDTPDPGTDPLGADPSCLSTPWDALAPILPLVSETAPPDLEAMTGHLRGIAPETWKKWERIARDLAEVDGTLEAARRAERDLEERWERAAEGLRSARDRIGEHRIAASEDSLARLRERLKIQRASSVALAEAARAAEELLAGARGGPFANRGALAQAHARADETRRDAQEAAARATRSSELAAAYARLEPAEADRMRRETESRLDAARQRRETARRGLDQARSKVEAWRPQARVNLADHELELAEGRRELDALRRRRDAAAAAWHLLGESIEEFQATHREDLERGLDERFRSITGRARRRVLIAPNLEIALVEEGSQYADEQLSQGARDQLGFCLRLAVADLVAGEIVMPMILDDPFVHSDAGRLDRIREALEAAAKDRQILVLTHDARLASWGSPVETQALTNLAPAPLP